MTEKLGSLRKSYTQVQAVAALCDALAATADGIHGRALEGARLDDKRAVEVPAASSAAQSAR